MSAGSLPGVSKFFRGSSREDGTVASRRGAHHGGMASLQDDHHGKAPSDDLPTGNRSGSDHGSGRSGAAASDERRHDAMAPWLAMIDICTTYVNADNSSTRSTSIDSGAHLVGRFWIRPLPPPWVPPRPSQKFRERIPETKRAMRRIGRRYARRTQARIVLGLSIHSSYPVVKVNVISQIVNPNGR